MTRSFQNVEHKRGGAYALVMGGGLKQGSFLAKIEVFGCEWQEPTWGAAPSNKTKVVSP